MAQKEKKKKDRPVGHGPDEPEDGPKVSRRSPKMVRITLFFIIVALLVIVLLWGMTPEDYPSVSEISDGPDDYIGKEIEVKGSVSQHEPINKTFVLQDGDDMILVYYSKALPSNFEVGKDAVVKGLLELREDDTYGTSLVLQAYEVIVGCASKYE